MALGIACAADLAVDYRQRFHELAARECALPHDRGGERGEHAGGDAAAPRGGRRVGGFTAGG